MEITCKATGSCSALIFVLQTMTYTYNTVSAVSGSKNMITGRAVPGLHIMRRLITNYRPGSRDASITIVYRTYSSVKVRWFRKADQRLPNSEIPDMLTIEGLYILNSEVQKDHLRSVADPGFPLGGACTRHTP